MKVFNLSCKTVKWLVDIIDVSLQTNQLTFYEKF